MSPFEFAACTLAALAAPGAALAQAGAAPLPARLESIPSEADDGWEFSVTPYVWAAGLKGDVGVIPGRPPSDADLSFGF